MNLTKLVLDLMAIGGAAIVIVVVLLTSYSLAVGTNSPFYEILSDSTLTLMWASTVIGLLAGKYR